MAVGAVHNDPMTRSASPSPCSALPPLTPVSWSNRLTLPRREKSQQSFLMKCVISDFRQFEIQIQTQNPATIVLLHTDLLHC